MNYLLNLKVKGDHDQTFSLEFGILATNVDCLLPARKKHFCPTQLNGIASNKHLQDVYN